MGKSAKRVQNKMKEEERYELRKWMEKEGGVEKTIRVEKFSELARKATEELGFLVLDYHIRPNAKVAGITLIGETALRRQKTLEAKAKSQQIGLPYKDEDERARLHAAIKQMREDIVNLSIVNAVLLRQLGTKFEHIERDALKSGIKMNPGSRVQEIDQIFKRRRGEQ